MLPDWYLHPFPPKWTQEPKNPVAASLSSGNLGCVDTEAASLSSGYLVGMDTVATKGSKGRRLYTLIFVTRVEK